MTWQIMDQFFCFRIVLIYSNLTCDPQRMVWRLHPGLRAPQIKHARLAVWTFWADWWTFSYPHFEIASYCHSNVRVSYRSQISLEHCGICSILCLRTEDWIGKRQSLPWMAVYNFHPLAVLGNLYLEQPRQQNYLCLVKK
jgi:hypothetical protein